MGDGCEFIEFTETLSIDRFSKERESEEYNISIV
jgi:hypothetical protein